MDKYKKIKCQSCGTQSEALFMRAPPRHSEDTYCKKCMDDKKHL